MTGISGWAKDVSRPLRHGVKRWQWEKRTAKLFEHREPVTLNEKIQYRMRYDRRPLLTVFADKIASREYAKEKCPDVSLPEVYLVTDNPREILASEIPDRCVIKPSHGSGALIFVDDRAPFDVKLMSPQSGGFWSGAPRVRRDAIASDEFQAIAANWMRATWNPISEPAYWDVPRRVIVEELLEVGGACRLTTSSSASMERRFSCNFMKIGIRAMLAPS